MCYTVRTSAKDLPTFWEWQADDQWIPYDLPSCQQIEAAWQSVPSIYLSIYLSISHILMNERR
jgi:hypothetical protein